MIGLLLVAHEPLATAWHGLCAHVYPEAMAAVAAVDVAPGLDLDSARQAVLAGLSRLPQASPLLVLTDVPGATPCNAASAALTGMVRPHSLITGANLPMIWRALCNRELALDDVVHKVLAVGQQAVAVQPTGQQ